MHIPQSHSDLAAKFLTALAMPGVAMLELSLLTATGTSDILNPQCRPCHWSGDALRSLGLQTSCCSLFPPSPFPRVPPAHPSPAKLVLQLCKEGFCRNNKVAELQQHHCRSHPPSDLPGVEGGLV